MNSFIDFIIEQQFEILTQTFQHIYLTLVALIFAIFIGVLIGVFISRVRELSSGMMGLLGVIQTIPSLALLGFMIPILGIGEIPAIVALFLYALLPIVRNTYTGIVAVEDSVVEAARGMGMTNTQILGQVELPLAIPVIFAGIRTATVINVGVATLCSLIGAGGLGEFIFSGISLNNTYMTLAGAIPAAILALLLDGILALIQKYIQKIIRPVMSIFMLIIIGVFAYSFSPLVFVGETQTFKAGFDPEFSQRGDGYPALQQVYGLRFGRVLEMDAGLMYEALQAGTVDVISGYSTEGKIDAYNLLALKDDKSCFPPYFVAPVFYGKTLEKYPELRAIFDKIKGKIPDSTMRRLNYEVDKEKQFPKAVATKFLKQLGLKTSTRRSGKADIVVAGKKFTEQYILVEMFKLLIENYSDLTVDVKKGMGGTKIIFDALKIGEVDIYPEYTGTAFLVILNPDETQKNKLIKSERAVFDYVSQQCLEKYQVVWLDPLGFNNTYALMMRKEQAQELNIKSISDLKKYLEK